MQDEGNRGVGAALVMVARFDPAAWTADIYFRHKTLASTPTLRLQEKEGAADAKKVT
jgi:hypothetical protein